MIKWYMIIVMIVFLSSCGDEEGLEGKKSELNKLKKEAVELNKKITELQQQILQRDSTDKKNKKIVKVIVLKQETYVHRIRIDGVVKTDEDIMITPEFQGRIDQLYVKEGETVHKGQILAQINTDVLKEQLQELQIRYDLAQTIYKKQSELWAKKIGSEVQYLEAKNNKEALEKNVKKISKQLKLASITSPIEGVIESIFQKEGAVANPVQPFAWIVNIESLYVESENAESYVPNIKIGDSLTVILENNPAKKAVIQSIGNVINPQNRSFKIKIKISNNSGMVKVNALAELLIPDVIVDSALVVPAYCIQKDIKGQYIYIIKPNQRGQDIAIRKYVKPGNTNENNQTLIKDGLAESDKIVVQGYNHISNGMEVKIIK